MIINNTVCALFMEKIIFLPMSICNMVDCNEQEIDVK